MLRPEGGDGPPAFLLAHLTADHLKKNIFIIFD
jgi:hypothetical protein